MAVSKPIPPGSDFPSSVILEARRLAFFRCCYCHDKAGDDVHHIVPKAEGGQGILENAILLCVQCHRDYGDRPDKRQQLRQARDHWYEIVERRYGSNVSQVEYLDKLATKQDVEVLGERMQSLFQEFMASVRHGGTSTSAAVNVASTMINSFGIPSQTIGAPKCKRCGVEIAMGAWRLCQACGAEL